MAAKKADKAAKSKADSKPKPPGKRGGARANAGRPTKEITLLKHQANLAAAQTISGWSPDLLKNLKKLADGGYLRVKEEFEPAGLIMIDVPAETPIFDNDGLPVMSEGKVVMRPLLTTNGAPIFIKVRAFPDLPADQLVRVSSSTETADADRAANEYLLNRVAGKPVLAIEHTGADGQKLPPAVEVSINKIYGAVAKAEKKDEVADDAH